MRRARIFGRMWGLSSVLINPPSQSTRNFTYLHIYVFHQNLGWYEVQCTLSTRRFLALFQISVVGRARNSSGTQVWWTVGWFRRIMYGGLTAELVGKLQQHHSTRQIHSIHRLNELDLQKRKARPTKSTPWSANKLISLHGTTDPFQFSRC